MTERERQEAAAIRLGDGVSCQEWQYLCADGETFSAVAPTESGAFRVLNSERPGMLANFVGSLTVLAPVPSLSAS